MSALPSALHKFGISLEVELIGQPSRTEFVLPQDSWASSGLVDAWVYRAGSSFSTLKTHFKPLRSNIKGMCSSQNGHFQCPLLIPKGISQELGKRLEWLTYEVRAGYELFGSGSSKKPKWIPSSNTQLHTLQHSDTSPSLDRLLWLLVPPQVPDTGVGRKWCG